jgi:hypothetical protein
LRWLLRADLGLVPALIAGLILAVSGSPPSGYEPSPGLADTNRTTPAGHSTGSRAALISISGYLSSWGLPPVPGQFSISDTAVIFRSAQGFTTSMAAALSLAYIERENGGVHYLFRVEGGILETDAPGALLEVVRNRPVALTRKAWPHPPGELGRASPSASLLEAQRIAASLYADTLYHLLGRPRAAVGLIGARGRAAGRLGEYIVRRDSLAFDPGRMIGEAQLRHALAHELGHRWQGRSRAELASLWAGVPGIRDPKRYGYGEKSEHQAEALAFAINFLQTTATGWSDPAALSLLEHYELLVPGTRVMVRYFADQPIYRRHPLRLRLLATPLTHAPAN